MGARDQHVLVERQSVSGGNTQVPDHCFHILLSWIEVSRAESSLLNGMIAFSITDGCDGAPAQLTERAHDHCT